MRPFVLVGACMLAATTVRGAERVAPGTAIQAGRLADVTAVPPRQAPQ